ncbi:Transmembrane protein 170 [Ophiocordyceps camponoti-floridani]|uniref:Transmembrane protein 170 n=1 Tax=Ophiocordyceps camponoti-floridani TaxID=2030778 RepID=A0A8H4VAK4_9HYPO|nr:Transmembrane protein 170 [Ophiocordyceps camponoti-floridani]
MSYPNDPPPGYETPDWPGLGLPILGDHTPDKRHTLYTVGASWRFTLLWTLVTYAVVHVAVVFIAFCTHGWKRASWKYTWALPIIYLIVAGIEAVFAGSVTGLMVGAIYRAGYHEMNTWVPLVWGFINVLVLIVSSFSFSGGL